jgi:hypothetical protein
MLLAKLSEFQGAFALCVSAYGSLAIGLWKVLPMPRSRQASELTIQRMSK